MTIAEELQQNINTALNQLINRNSRDCCIYPWSNEHIENYYNYYDLTNKKILCITGSGDHARHAILAGATKIDCVDINPLAKYYQALKLAFIKKYNESDFWNQYSHEDYYQILSTKIKIDSLKEFLDEETYVFWKFIIKQPVFEYNKYLFRFDGEPVSLIYNYKETKKNINNAEITYYDDDIKFFIKDIDIKYDAIFLSNILEWQMKSIRQDIIEDCFNILNPNGVVYDAICKREFNNTEIFNNLETKIPTEFYKDGTTVRKGVYVYRKK